MRQQYAIRSLILAAGLAFVGLAVMVQMVRIQNSEQAKVFLSQGDLYAGEFRMFYPSAVRSTTVMDIYWLATAPSMKLASA